MVILQGAFGHPPFVVAENGTKWMVVRDTKGEGGNERFLFVYAGTETENDFYTITATDVVDGLPREIDRLGPNDGVITDMD